MILSSSCCILGIFSVTDEKASKAEATCVGATTVNVEVEDVVVVSVMLVLVSMLTDVVLSMILDVSMLLLLLLVAGMGFMVTLVVVGSWEMLVVVVDAGVVLKS